ncbi:NAD-dependent epimerase/dehydratase family protein [Longitalea luteola]|uniref:NAD-dependent epimerase/dehydratase family protein n=1 Tax=Longitalea luteola TaxID=2812563 RepID=UPI001A97BE3B|nr:NAD-dependent epimerase/dehydratase family protein [Longitalea luteola]
MITSLVTGGAGFIGSHVARSCLELGHKVIVIDDLSGGFEDNLPPGVLFIKGSVYDNELLKQIFETYTINFVYHLAAYAAEGLSHFIRRFNYDNNLIGSVNLINLAVLHKVDCFVFTSSIAVYGAGQLPMTENMVPEPEDPYGIAKYSVELDLMAARRLFGLNYIIFRPHNVYGENQNIGDRYRNVIGIFMNEIMNGRELTIFGDGEQTRAFSYISDVAPVIARSVHVREAYNEIINIGGDNAYSVNYIARLIADAFGVVASIKYYEARKEVLHAFCDHTKARNYFGEVTHTHIEEGIKKMAAWAKLKGARSSTVYDNIEIEENLPVIWRKPVNEIKD